MISCWIWDHIKSSKASTWMGDEINRRIPLNYLFICLSTFKCAYVYIHLSATENGPKFTLHNMVTDFIIFRANFLALKWYWHRVPLLNKIFKCSVWIMQCLTFSVEVKFLRGVKISGSEKCVVLVDQFCIIRKHLIMLNWRLLGYIALVLLPYRDFISQLVIL